MHPNDLHLLTTRTTNHRMSCERRRIVAFLQEFFSDANCGGQNCNAVIGISGGKDSAVVAALCVEALGADRVIGVMIPNGVQADINDSVALCEHLGIKQMTVNIEAAYRSLIEEVGEGVYDPNCNGYTPKPVSKQTEMNLPPRLRMATLYAVGQTYNGRVVNTSNLSEWMIGWETRWGDAVGDVQPILHLTATEVVELGKLLLPEHFVVKPPADGLCGKTDEEAFGFTYAELDEVIEWMRNGADPNTMKLNIIKYDKICRMIGGSAFKRRAIPSLLPNV